MLVGLVEKLSIIRKSAEQPQLRIRKMMKNKSTFIPGYQNSEYQISNFEK